MDTREHEIARRIVHQMEDIHDPQEIRRQGYRLIRVFYGKFPGVLNAAWNQFNQEILISDGFGRFVDPSVQDAAEKFKREAIQEIEGYGTDSDNRRPEFDSEAAYVGSLEVGQGGYRESPGGEGVAGNAGDVDGLSLIHI